MSIRFQADNDLNRLIVAANFRREPAIDFQTAQSAQLDYLDDETGTATGRFSGSISSYARQADDTKAFHVVSCEGK